MYLDLSYFVLYISDIASVLPHGVCNQEFADYIVVDYSDRDPAVVCAVLTTAVRTLLSSSQDEENMDAVNGIFGL